MHRTPSGQLANTVNLQIACNMHTHTTHGETPAKSWFTVLHHSWLACLTEVWQLYSVTCAVPESTVLSAAQTSNAAVLPGRPRHKACPGDHKSTSLIESGWLIMQTPDAAAVLVIPEVVHHHLSGGPVCRRRLEPCAQFTSNMKLEVCFCPARLVS